MGKIQERSRWPEVAAALAIVVVGSFALWQHRMRADALERLSATEAGSRALRARFDQATREIEALRGASPAPAPLQIEPIAPPARTEGVEAARLLIQMREKLAAAAQSVQTLDARVRELEASVEKLSMDNRRLAASETDLKESAARTNRIVEAMRFELNGKDERLSQLMATNTQLLNQYRESAARLDALPKLVRDLDEIDRQREAYLSGVLRRFREITDRYRALSARSDDPGAGAAAVPAGDLLRVQTAVQMAEDDMRQISALNAQAGRLRQKLTGK